MGIQAHTLTKTDAKSNSHVKASSTGVHLRRATSADTQRIAKIHHLSWQTAYQECLPHSYVLRHNVLSDKVALWQKVLASDKVTTWLACATPDKASALGFISYFYKDGRYHITTIYILPEYQGAGIGQQLMAQALADMRVSGQADTVSLWVLQDNQPAIDFYVRQGFVRSGEVDYEAFEAMQITDIEMIKKL